MSVNGNVWNVNGFINILFTLVRPHELIRTVKIGSASAFSRFIIIMGGGFSLADISLCPCLARASSVIVSVFDKNSEDNKR